MKMVLIIAGALLLIGLIIVGITGKKILNDFNMFPIFFCLGWSVIGLAAGIINDRYSEARKLKEPHCKCLFRLMYFIFVAMVITLLASTSYFWVKDNNAMSLTLAALVGIAGGFLGYRNLEALLFNARA